MHDYADSVRNRPGHRKVVLVGALSILVGFVPSLLVCRVLIAVTPVTALEFLYDQIQDLYGYLRLTGTPYEWNWATMTFNLILALPYAVFVMVIQAVLLRVLSSSDASPSPKCSTCGYSLHGLLAVKCPECGKVN